jgi:hypothetical protein
VRLVELAARGCRDQGPDDSWDRACERARLKWSRTDHLGGDEIKSRLKSAGCAS